MILHLDMDAFFAAIEQRDHPELKGKPVIVSGSSDRSVVCTASYEARIFGIHSAMPVFQAKKRCPDLIIVPVNHAKYSEASHMIMAILKNFSPLVEPVSIDEAYMDISGCSRLFGTPRDMAAGIKRTIRETLSLTCSIGIAPLKYLAKIASDMNKPDGITLIEKNQVPEFITHLDIKKVPGVGHTVFRQMQTLHIHKLGDILALDSGFVIKKFGKLGERLVDLANGIDPSPVEPEHIRKSISRETTLSKDTADPAFIRQTLLGLSQEVGKILRQKQRVCGTVFIKLKFSDFTQITRTRKLDNPISSSTMIYNESLCLLDQVSIKRKIRLIGVGVSSLWGKNVPVQMALPGTGRKCHQHWEHVDRAIDSISEKFGPDIIQKAALSRVKKETS